MHNTAAVPACQQQAFAVNQVALVFQLGIVVVAVVRQWHVVGAAHVATAHLGSLI